MTENLPSFVYENIDQDEEILHSLKKKLRTEAKPKRIIVTNKQVLYVDQKLMGRYDLKSIPYQKLKKVEFDSGIMASEFEIETESGEEVELDWLGKEKSKEAIKTIKDALNRIAVEPINIDKSKGFKSETWELKKPKESVSKVMRKNPQLNVNQNNSSSDENSAADKLKELKELKDEEIISEEEYEEKRKDLMNEL